MWGVDLDAARKERDASLRKRKQEAAWEGEGGVFYNGGGGCDGNDL